jgi:hypothetical protein
MAKKTPGRISGRPNFTAQIQVTTQVVMQFIPKKKIYKHWEEVFVDFLQCYKVIVKFFYLEYVKKRKPLEEVEDEAPKGFTKKIKMCEGKLIWPQFPNTGYNTTK